LIHYCGSVALRILHFCAFIQVAAVLLVGQCNWWSKLITEWCFLSQ